MAHRWSHARLSLFLAKRELVIAAIVLMTAFTVAAVELNKGAASLEIPAQSKGNVLFPHRLHQEMLGDCTICHFLFPQIPGSIKDLKAEGKLQKKRVMNKLCVKCHMAEKKAGNKSGPTACSKCHIK